MKTKYAVLATELRRLCLQLSRSGITRLPGEEELCRRYGCSRQTVRRALSILEESGLIVRIHGSGTYLSDGHPGIIGQVAVITAYTEEYLYPQLLRDISAALSPSGYELQHFGTGNRVVREREILSELLRNPPAGVLLEGAKTALPSPNLDLLGQLERNGIPLVFLHAPLPVPSNAPAVMDDNEGGSRLLVRHLLDRGHQKIAGIFKSDDRQGTERYLGFFSELLAEGLSVSEDLILWYSTENRDQLMSGHFDWLDRFVFTRLPDASAVVCYNDEIAYPLIRTLIAAGRRVPEDIAVVSFDNSHFCTLSPVPLTSLAHERHQMGTEAAHTLLRLMRGKEAHSIRLPWTLHERSSG